VTCSSGTTLKAAVCWRRAWSDDHRVANPHSGRFDVAELIEQRARVGRPAFRVPPHAVGHADLCRAPRSHLAQ
jgi:hypothetical protein